MKSAIRCFVLLFFAHPLLAAGSPTTVNNDDSCEVIVTPAATLLLPYFDIDLSNPAGETTIFTITNVTQSPQIARVTLWTDLAYPVIGFNIFLTGYDIQTVNLFDVLARGRIAEPGTSSDEGAGQRSRENDSNPLLDIRNCNRLTVNIRQPLLGDVQSAFAGGRLSSCGAMKIGNAHTHAIGYATIDVVSTCGTTVPTDTGYFTGELLYDNVLIGDYEQVNSVQNFAQSAPMVHIRAVPEGGAAGMKKTNFRRTFYSRLQSGQTADRRQPLPSTFAARWIEGGETGFVTTFKIWREGLTGMNAGCSVAANYLAVTEIVRFDEVENPTVFQCDLCESPSATPVALPATSLVSSSASLFPPNTNESVAGWMYFNLDRGGRSEGPTQGWVTSSMKADGRYSVDFDAASFGNGCSPRSPVTLEKHGMPAIGPPSTANATFATSNPSTTDNDDSCDIRVAPAATLLLPFFEVDLSNPAGETTLLTITNVTQFPQIAHFTIWTDAAYPLYSFNVFLTGYDVQSINLYDVLATGRLPATSSSASVGLRSEGNDTNPLLDSASCEVIPDRLPESMLSALQGALTVGRTPGCGVAKVGSAHRNATGYVTVDVVDRCSLALPTDPDYFKRVLLYDNVLIGDYEQVNSTKNFAQGNTLVHIRAIPEGGRMGRATNFTRTFYSRLSSGTTDRRQPLPSTFAARWTSGGTTGLLTNLKIWREGLSTRSAGCAVEANLGLDLGDVVRFDEDENASVMHFIDAGPRFNPTAAASRRNVAGNGFPPNPNDSVAGWMYLNFGMTSLDKTPAAPNQSWVIVSMEAEGRYSVDFDAASLANGCSPFVPRTDEDGGFPAIGPAPNRNP